MVKVKSLLGKTESVFINDIKKDSYPVYCLKTLIVQASYNGEISLSVASPDMYGWCSSRSTMPGDGPTELVDNEKFQGEIMEMAGVELKDGDGDVEESSTFHTSLI